MKVKNGEKGKQNMRGTGNEVVVAMVKEREEKT